MPFQPGNRLGQGRPKGSGRNQIIREWCEQKGIQKLLDVAEGKGHTFREYNGRVVEIGPNENLQFEALKLALAYGMGKPTEMVEITKPTWDPEQSKLQADEVWKLIKELEDNGNSGTTRPSDPASVEDRPSSL